LQENKIDILGYSVFSGNPADIHFHTKKQTLINTINPHSYVIAKEDHVFQKALKSSDILLPDGIGIVLATKWIKGAHIKKIAGADIHRILLSQANENRFKVFYLGASNKTLNLIKLRLKKEYPNIQMSFYSPPYKDRFSEIDSKKMIDAVNAFNPDVLFVGMTAPKQEKWVFENKNKINASIIGSIGAVFDFYAGTVKRPSSFWINKGLEWFPRLLNEPKRLWKRNFVSTPVFLFDTLKGRIL